MSIKQKELNLLDIIAAHNVVPDQYVYGARDSIGSRVSNSKYPNQIIEKYFLKHNYISKGSLAKAYSLLYNIPYVSLSKYEIPKEVITLIPKKIAERYGIVAFYVENRTVYIAVSRPGLLRMEHHGVFEQLAEEKGVRIKLFITPTEHFEEALNWYDWQRPVGRVRLFDTAIDPISLRKISKDDANRMRLLAYQEVPALFAGRPYFRLATDQDKTKKLEEIIRFIEKNNNVFVSLYRTNSEDFDTVLAHYEDILKFTDTLSLKSLGEALAEISKPVKPPSTVMVPQANIVPAKLPEHHKSIFEEIANFFKALFEGHGNKSQQATLLSEKIIVKSPLRKTEPQSISAAKPMEMAPATTGESKKAEPKIVIPSTTIRLAVVKHGKRYIISRKGDKILDINYVVEGSEKKKEKTAEELAKDLASLLKSNVESTEQLEDVAMEGNIPQIVAALISYALFLEASDIHIEAQEELERIRFRVDGILQDIISLPLSIHPAIISRIKILSSSKIDETRLPQDGRFNVSFSGRDVDLRISTIPTVYGEKIVMRLLDKDKGLLTLGELGYSGKGYDDVINAISKPYGIILATGPTGCGKSTTLYTLLGKLSQPGVNVATLEDPVEYELKGINQSQIKPQIGFTFAEGLRSLMRQDPNIIMVGEIRDLDTASNATHAALTGHLVLSSLHTNDSAGALPRLIAMGVEPFLITSSINAVIGQRLVRKICKYCKQEVQPAPGLLADVEKEISLIPAANRKDRERVKRPFKFCKGQGCSKCKNGYKGRISINEVLPMSDAIEALAVKNAPASEILKQSQREGMITMKQDGYLKVIAGITTLEEVLRETRTD